MANNVSTLQIPVRDSSARHLPSVQAGNLYFHPNMTHAQMVNWKHEHLDGRKLVMKPEPKEVA